MNIKTIRAEKAHELLRTEPGTVLVCAFEKDEDFQQHRLQGAISLSKFRKRIHMFQKDETVIFYCDGPRDESAMRQAEKYRKQDFVNVRVLEGGVTAWKSAGYALHAGSGVLPQ
jgi:rhodanese-related sulfurtransferase